MGCHRACWIVVCYYLEIGMVGYVYGIVGESQGYLFLVLQDSLSFQYILPSRRAAKLRKGIPR